MKLDEATSIIDCLQYYAKVQPESPAYTYLENGTKHARSLNYGLLDEYAKKLAGCLLQYGLRGERVILIFPPGLEFMVALFACFYTGCLAVPSNLSRNSRHAERLHRIIDDAQAVAILTTNDLKNMLFEQLGRTDVLFISVDLDDLPASESWRESVLPANQQLAFMQYTSGSMSEPKGVMVSHGNLLSNIIAIRDNFGSHEKLVIGGWIPQFHDMGLIGHILHAVAIGGHYVFMSPLAFVIRPLRWLQLMQDYGCELSSAPNFAYDLCSNKIPEEMVLSLDLSRWRWAANGAEPVVAETIKNFSRKFSRAGFRASAMTPCYGMAETTLMISSSTGNLAPLIFTVCADSLADGRLVAVESTASNVQTLVACGTVASGYEVSIVDPHTKQVLSNGLVGEIWVRGPSVATGYWNNPVKTEQNFSAYTRCGHGPFLRTGDMGAFWEGQLVVVGRYKDIIIIRGRNIYPQDLERSLSSASPLVKLNKAAAFSVNDKLVLVQELEKGAQKHPDFSTIQRQLLQLITAEYDLSVHELVLIRANTLPITSSGKVQRSLCRKLYEQKRLNIVPANFAVPV